MRSCPTQPAFYAPCVRAWGETGLETWLSHEGGSGSWPDAT